MINPMNDGGPAFPQVQVDFGNGPECPGPFGMGGMSLRDYFAGQALAGAMANPAASALWSAKQMAMACYTQSDAMLAARAEKNQTKEQS